MDGPSLFDSMYSDDTEGKKLKEMPGVEELVIVYPLKFMTGPRNSMPVSLVIASILNQKLCLVTQ